MTPRVALDRLTLALVAARDTGAPPPCCVPGAADWWLSESADERRVAVVACGGCPLTTPCRAAADELRARFGVWAGRDRTPRPRRSRWATTA